MKEISHPTVGDLIHILDKAAVLAELSRLYRGEGESPEGYDRMWETLRLLQPKLTDTSVLLSQRWSIDEPPERIVDVSGIKGSDDTQWAIEFVDWREWLSMPILVDAELRHISDEERLAHCLYEMSCAGYTQEDIEQQFNMIVDLAEEAAELAGNVTEH